ncbi:MAG: hypothetical protein FD167_1701, partial [bacterium]
MLITRGLLLDNRPIEQLSSFLLTMQKESLSIITERSTVRAFALIKRLDDINLFVINYDLLSSQERASFIDWKRDK